MQLVFYSLAISTSKYHHSFHLDRAVVFQANTMALEDLTTGLQAISLSEPEHLLFNRTKANSWLRSKFNDIPRYLFRVSTPSSDGTTDEFWVKSKDARHGWPNSGVDILSGNQSQEVAEMLYRHLRWCGRQKIRIIWFPGRVRYYLHFSIYSTGTPKTMTDQVSTAFIYVLLTQPAFRREHFSETRILFMPIPALTPSFKVWRIFARRSTVTLQDSSILKNTCRRVHWKSKTSAVLLRRKKLLTRTYLV